jgi:hypothetical protein
MGWAEEKNDDRPNKQTGWEIIEAERKEGRNIKNMLILIIGLCILLRVYQ